MCVVNSRLTQHRFIGTEFQLIRFRGRHRTGRVSTWWSTDKTSQKAFGLKRLHAKVPRSDGAWADEHTNRWTRTARWRQNTDMPLPPPAPQTKRNACAKNTARRVPSSGVHADGTREFARQYSHRSSGARDNWTIRFRLRRTRTRFPRVSRHGRFLAKRQRLNGE